VRCVDERRDVVEEAKDVVGVREWRVQSRPGDAQLAQLVQRANFGFGALNGDGDVAIPTRPRRAGNAGSYTRAIALSEPSSLASVSGTNR